MGGKTALKSIDIMYAMGKVRMVNVFMVEVEADMFMSHRVKPGK